MTAESARGLCELLDENEIAFWVVGGWGVDALLETETRTHKDLDILVPRGDNEPMWRLLHEQGWKFSFTWAENVAIDGGPDGPELPSAYMLTDADDRLVDVHVLDQDGDDRFVPLWNTERVFIDGALDARGSIDGYDVACMSAQMQRLAHVGYELPESQRRDLDLIADMT